MIKHEWFCHAVNGHAAHCCSTCKPSLNSQFILYYVFILMLFKGHFLFLLLFWLSSDLSVYIGHCRYLKMCLKLHTTTSKYTISKILVFIFYSSNQGRIGNQKIPVGPFTFVAQWATLIVDVPFNCQRVLGTCRQLNTVVEQGAVGCQLALQAVGCLCTTGTAHYMVTVLVLVFV